MNSVMEFLAENYLYVALGSLFIIIVLILIIIISNKKANKREKEEMVNIGDIKTGSIDEVAGNIRQEKTVEEGLQPQSIGELTQSIPVISTEPAAPKPVESPVVEKVAEPTLVAEPQQVSTTPEVKPIEPVAVPIQAAPVMAEPTPTPVVEVRFEEPKPIEPVAEPVPTVPVMAEPTPTPVVEVRFEEPKPIEPVVAQVEPNIPVIEPIPTPVVESPKEELEVFGIESTAPKGNAVSGFSSVNVEK